MVILTGEALRRENAEAIAGLLAEQRGDFVTATAGHHMESMLAAYGSGASQVSHDEGKRILNLDIGGGTAKLAIVDKGDVIATAALHIGGRLQVVDDIGRIVRLDPAGQLSRPRGRLLLVARRRALARAARQGGGEHGRSAGRGAHAAAGAARDRASLPDRSDRRARPASTA